MITELDDNYSIKELIDKQNQMNRDFEGRINWAHGNVDGLETKLEQTELRLRALEGLVFSMNAIPKVPDKCENCKLKSCELFP